MYKTFKEWMDEEEEGYQPPSITPEIKAWLGNSVIQQPVYHGSRAKFNQFQIQKSKRFVLFSAFDVEAHGFFFSEDYETAKTYGPNVVTAYVKMLNPVVDPRIDKHLGVDRLPNRREAQIAFILRHMIQRHPEWGQYGDLGTTTFPVYARGRGTLRKSIKNRIPDFYTTYEWIYNVIGREGLLWDALDNPQVVASMKRLGYDGTFVQENNDLTGRSIFVPNADQIQIVEWTK